MTADARVAAPLSAFRRGLRCALLALPLWLGLMQLPAPVSIEMLDARPMALDYAVRHGLGLGTDLPAATGPLGALLTATASGQPLWVNFWCQVLTGAAFAVGLSWLVWRLRPPARWWVCGGLLVVAGFRADYLHPAVLLLVGTMLLSRPAGRGEAAGAGLILGLLALIDVRLALLGGAGLALNLGVPPVSGDRRPAVLAGAAFGLVFATGWLWCGQPAGDVLPWLAHGLAPSALRHPAAAWSTPALVFGLLAFAAMVAVLAGTVLASASRWRALVPAGFVFVVLFLLWRRSTGQPGPGPQLFLAGVAMAGLGWIALPLSPAPRRWLTPAAIGAIAAALLGLLAVEPRILTESIILLNRKMVANATALADRPAWQRTLGDSFRSAEQLFALPRIRSATAGRSTDLLGNATGYALVNRFTFAPRPGLQGYDVTAALAARNAAYYAGAGAPDFVVQRLQAFDRGLPALEDGPAQLALYAGYDFQFEENGFVLWQRRPGPAAAVTFGAPAWQGSAAWDQPVALPVQPGRAYWVTVTTRRSALGWLQGQLFAPADPTLVLHDAEGGALSYRAAPAALATGFLLSPLFRGEVDVIRYQAGEPLPLIREITLQKPAGREGDFSGRVEIALHEVAVPPVSGKKESAALFAQRFRIADRLPVAVAAYYPPQTTSLDGREVLLAHPDSSLEFPVRAGDAVLQGGCGLLDGAYQNGNATDGVEFVVEYVPARGAPAILWRRLLDPVKQPGDRGIQSFTVTLPQPASGRVILRTQNPPGHNAAWDWSLWTDLRFSSAPATK